MDRVAQEPAFDYVVTGAIAQAILAPLLESLRPNVLADVYLDTGGTGTITFSDANNGTFAYTLSGIAQTKAITRELIGPQPTCLFGALAEAHGFVKDPDSLALWAGRRDTIFDEIERLDAKTRGPAAIRLIGATP